MTQPNLPLPQAQSFGQTSRRDAWWLQPLLVFLGLSAFVVYATWGALQNEHYYSSVGGAHYLSPFYSPVLWDVPEHVSGHALFGPKPQWWPTVLPFFPAFLILWVPGGLRFTCYYYRGTYYKAFWADPPSCGVGEPRKSYRGEHSFPLIMQNIHRYFLYLGLIFIMILAYDAWKGFWFLDVATGKSSIGLHVGSLVLLTNAILLGGYTLGCHSLRHLVGGGLDVLSRRPVRRKSYDCISCLNRSHATWAWVSLFWVAFTDFYVRMCSMGVVSDVVIIG